MMLELLELETIPSSMMEGERASRYANSDRTLRKISTLKPWGLRDVLQKKYSFSKYVTFVSGLLSLSSL